MEEDDAPGTKMAQRCNLCWQEANGSCFRTLCGHLFCESCAFGHFGQNQTCPSCGSKLSESDISDLTVGLEPATDFQRMMFQEIYKDPDYRSVSQAVVRTAMALHESVAFVLAQLTMETQRVAATESALNGDLSKLRHENGRLTMQLRTQASSLEQRLREGDHKLRLKEKEFVDLQEAYKEKSRKCQAWEKAYGNLRNQVETGGRGDGRGGGSYAYGQHLQSPPPQSPRMSGTSGPMSFVHGGSAPSGVGGYSPGSRTGSARTHQMGGGGDMQMTHRQSPSSSPRARQRSFMAPGGGGGNATGVAAGHGGPWSHARPGSLQSTTPHQSPLLRPRSTNTFTPSVTPSPTLQPEQGGSYVTRPETPMAVRGYYVRKSPKVNSAIGRGGGARGRGGGGNSGSEDYFAQQQKEPRQQRF